MFQCHMCDEYSDSINRNMHGVQNKIYKENRIPMTVLWCTAFSNHG